MKKRLLIYDLDFGSFFQTLRLKDKQYFYMNKQVNHLISFEEFQHRYIGAEGSKERMEFDAHADKAVLGTLIAQMRKSQNLTQTELAEKLHNKQEYISRIESGKTDIRLSTFLKILHILNFKLQAVEADLSK